MKNYTDKELLDFLQKLLEEENYTGRCIMRMSGGDRGFRLHETTLDDAVPDVREAIKNFIENEKNNK